MSTSMVLAVLAILAGAALAVGFVIRVRQRRKQEEIRRQDEMHRVRRAQEERQRSLESRGIKSGAPESRTSSSPISSRW